MVVTCLCSICSLSGCGGNSNEAEYLRTTSPGARAEEESVASRRERTKAVPKTPEKTATAKRRAAN
jgi:hypothetical protein